MSIVITTLAAKKDKKLSDDFIIHMAGLRRAYASWLSISPVRFIDGAPYLLQSIVEADVVAALISADLLFHLDEQPEMRDTIARRLKEVRVCPIILRPCAWNDLGSIFKGISARPYGKAVTQHQNADEAWMEVTTMIRSFVERVHSEE